MSAGKYSGSMGDLKLLQKQASSDRVRTGSATRKSNSNGEKLQSKGMDWLYLLISSTVAKAKFELDPDARQWLNNRIAMANEAKSKNTKHSRDGSVWWENKSNILAKLNTSSPRAAEAKHTDIVEPKPAPDPELFSPTRETKEGWQNKKGWKSLKVKIVSGDFSDLELKEEPTSFLAVSLGLVGKTTLRIPGFKPVWKEEDEMIFPLSETDLYLNVVALKGEAHDDLLGTIQIPVRNIEKKPGQVTMQMWNADQTENVDCEVTLECSLSMDEPPKESAEKDHGGALSYIRGLVSKKKCRYTEGGFDLDLSYVGNRLIAMGFPSEGFEGAYRNPMSEVQRFLQKKHAKHYAVYNLCSERAYPPDKFPICKRFPFDDHNPCPFNVLVGFCKDVKEYLDRHPQNVAAIHCKAGKGRTGLTISAYLIYSGQCKTAKEALDFFASKRTKDGKGVTIQSQRRYVLYFEKYVNLRRQNLRPKDRTLMLYTITLRGIKFVSENIWFKILNKDRTYKSEKTLVERRPIKDDKGKRIIYSLERSPIPLHQDAKVVFFKSNVRSNEKMFHFWFNTMFVEGKSIKFEKKFIDKASRDKKHKKYGADLCVELNFTPTKSLDSRRRSNSPLSHKRRSYMANGNRPSERGRLSTRKLETLGIGGTSNSPKSNHRSKS